ncbi:MAG: hypothetical protein KAS30_01240, partial [Candidatus Diapherotrites archaeon]|nr:hypothetical protein [Candidatus Diapherotrites archaeon]
YNPNLCDSPTTGVGDTWIATPGGAPIFFEIASHESSSNTPSQDYNNLMQRDEIICNPPHINAGI